MGRSPAKPRTIAVEVAYATPERQLIKSLDVAPGSTVHEVILLSGLLEAFPEIDLHRNPVGIFSEIVTLTRVVSDRDRVEIYRALAADPKIVRRELAALGRVMGGSDKPRDK